ncbi:MAG: hypothetical protein LBU83_10385 [Bacteroidales bacterium]|jgi:hypothetical protein|nr:hypothetical protein [Bacteroidales bacterium]
MKKIFMILAILFVAVTLNAQFFIGGEFKIDVEGNRAKLDADKNLQRNVTNFEFLLAPKFGYYFNDKLAVGLKLGLGPKCEFDNTNKDNKSTKTEFSWGIYPFVRYSVFTYKKFAIIMEGSIGFGGTHEFAKYGKEKQKNLPYTINIQVFNITPVLSFNLSDHWQLEAGLNFLDIGYGIDVRKSSTLSDKKYNSTETSHKFKFIVNSNTIINTAFTIGASYKF